MSQSKNQILMTKLLKSDDKFIKSAIKQIRRPSNINFDDLYQEARIAYMSVIGKSKFFAVDKSVEQIAYIKRGIKNHLIQYLDNQNYYIEEIVNDEYSDLSKYFMYLTELEQYIVENRYVYNSYGYTKISKIIGCSNRKIINACNSALNKLKLVLEMDSNFLERSVL